MKEKVQTIHHHEYFKDTDYEKYLPKIKYHFDEPSADSAFFSNFKVAELAKKYVTVTLTGD
jgi:asparagine synthase (glutamine-hydrolysing)